MLPLPPDVPRLAEGPEYEACLGMIRSDAEGARAMAEAWEAAGGGEGARHCGALALLGMGEPERAAERLEQLGRASRSSAATRASLFAQAGQAWMMAGQGSRAFGTTTMGLGLTPDDAELLLDRAVALGTLARYAEAMEDVNRVLALDPDRAEAWVFRAAANRHLEKVDQAAADVERALALAPENAEALLERGIIRQLKGDTAGAGAGLGTGGEPGAGQRDRGSGAAEPGAERGGAAAAVEVRPLGRLARRPGPSRSWRSRACQKSGLA